jgi:cyclophilin family peptidyl-prolyl cis-trans isomerase
MDKMMRNLAALLLSMLVATAACAQQNPRVAVKTTAGSFVLELNPKAAPKTVENFLQYAKDGFYDGTIFHRVIDGFMIQGGGFDKQMRQKPTRAPVENEAESALKAGLRNDVGTVAMARTPNPHSATAQFFINVKKNDFLDFREPTAQGYGYTVFGRVVQGMEVVQRIAKAPTTTAGMFRDVPATPVVIESVSILPAK